MTKFEARKFFDFDKSINQGGILYFNNIKGKYIYQWMSHLSQLANIDMDIPIGHLTQKQLDMISWGKKVNDKYPDKMHEGIIIQAQRRMRESTSSLVHEQLEKYMIKGTCQYCSGSGYSSWALSQRIDDKNILDYLVMDIKELYQIAKEKVFAGKKLEKKMWSEIKSRCQYLIDSGLHYLTPHRQMNTLSGGEYNRIRFAVQLSAALSGITYVLDEPGLGLHPADYKSLIKNIRRLLEKNNHVLLIEHREDILEQSDYIVECGPGAGNLGGQVLYQGQLSPQAKRIWQYLYSKKQLSESKKVKSTLHLGPFDTNNLQQIHIDIHTKSLNILCGVSGSGKSTLFRELKNNYQIKKILNKTFSQIYHMDQKAMGKSIRSNPATITGVFEFIRQFYAQLPESRIKGYKLNHFSFNSKEGQCDQCRGIGEQKIDMHFMPDIYVPCDICNGQRYLAEILQIEYKGFNINQILEMSFAEANKFFAHLAQIKHRMQAMVDVGLEYLKLGQRSHYLSGGEWQRLKLACELGKSQAEPVLYLLDEPTSGLFFSDIEQLLKVFDSLIERGHTLLLIEHNPNLLARADHLIEMGPGGGREGGQVIFNGTPNKLVELKTPSAIALNNFLARHNGVKA